MSLFAVKIILGGGKMERPVIKNMTELKDMCLPIMEYLKEFCDPYVEVHIGSEDIRVTSTECFIPKNAPTD